MSGYTQTNTETLYSYYGAATVSTPTTTPGSSLTLTYPPIIIPAGYFNKLGPLSSSLRFKAGGLLTATATIPTWQLFLYLTTSNSFGSTLTLASTATFTPTAATNVPWWWECEIGARGIGLGAASTLVAMGEVQCSTFPSPFFQPMPTTGAYSPLATYQNDIQYYLWPALSLASATAGNTMTTEFVKLYGEN